VTDFLQHYPQGVILAMDEVSLYFQATLTQVWSPIGHTPLVKVCPQRDHIHFYGALNVRNGHEFAVTALEQTSQITANFLQLVLLLYPHHPSLLLLDRATWHFGQEIRQVLHENPAVWLVYFPPACPELNPQEHVWEQTRDRVSHNHVYREFPSLIDVFDRYLNETPFETDFLSNYAPLTLCEV
jgi:transposase